MCIRDSLRCEGVNDVDSLKSLEPGVYNIYYTAYPKNAEFSGKVTPTHKLQRQVATLTVLDKNDLSAINLYGRQGVTAFENHQLSEVELPEGYSWTCLLYTSWAGSSSSSRSKWTFNDDKTIY